MNVQHNFTASLKLALFTPAWFLFLLFRELSTAIVLYMAQSMLISDLKHKLNLSMFQNRVIIIAYCLKLWVFNHGVCHAPRGGTMVRTLDLK